MNAQIQITTAEDARKRVLLILDRQMSGWLDDIDDEFDGLARMPIMAVIDEIMLELRRFEIYRNFRNSVLDEELCDWVIKPAILEWKNNQVK